MNGNFVSSGAGVGRVAASHLHRAGYLSVYRSHSLLTGAVIRIPPVTQTALHLLIFIT